MRATNKEIILDAIIDLYNTEQIVTRELLFEVLDLKKAIIDDNITSLINEGRVLRLRRGVYAPISTHTPARLIWKGTLPCGLIKIDIGDDIALTLTPKEARTLGKDLMGEGMQYANIEMGQHMTQLIATYEHQVKNLMQEIKQLKDKAAGADKEKQ